MNNQATETPKFKVARVGNDRKKKGFGLSFFRPAGPKGVGTGLKGGAGSAAAGAATTGFKSAIAIFLVAGISGGSIYLGARDAKRGPAQKVEKPRLFAASDVKLEGDTTSLPKTEKTMPNSLGYISGSADGLTPEERARLAEEAAAKAAEEEAARKAEEEAAASAQPPVDPAALAGAAGQGGEQKKGLGGKFGQLSSSFGGGSSSLSGGSGLSGGITRNFGLGNSGNAKGMRGMGGNLGKFAATGARTGLARTGRAPTTRSNAKGFAHRQLANANALSRAGLQAPRGETAAYNASSAFDNNQGHGNAITGQGINTGAGPQNADSGFANPNPVNNGGALDRDYDVDCGDNAELNEDGGCTPTNNNGQNVTPWQWAADLAQVLLGVIAVIALIKSIMDKSFIALSYGAVLGTIIGIMGAVIGLLGIYIMTQGDFMQGMVFGAIGGFISAIAFVPGASDYLTSGSLLLSAGAGVFIGQISKQMAKSQASAGSVG
jgi:hypothetical protein